MRIFASRAQVETAVGEDLGASQWILVDQKMIDDFADLTGDRQWIHVDTIRGLTPARKIGMSGCAMGPGLK